MTLDPHAAVVLARMGEAPSGPVSLAAMRAGARRWLEFAGAPEAVARVEHRYVSSPTADVPVRIYTPGGSPPFAALVYFHGGGWVVNNLEVVDPGPRALANRTGCVVVAAGYQKAPEHPFPIPLQDCYAVTEWVAAHADELGVGRIGVGGDSSGGNLAAAVCLRARDEGGPALAIQVLLYPAIEPRFDTASMREHATGYGLTAEMMRWYWDQYLPRPQDADDPLACPIRASSLAGLPPAIVWTAEHDVLRDEGERFAAALQAAGVAVSARRCAGQVHGFLRMIGAVPSAARIVDELGVEVRRVLGAP